MFHVDAGDNVIGIGAAGSEKIVAADLTARSSSITDEVRPSFIALPVAIPAGSRIAVRAQCSITDATDHLFDIALYGFR